MLLLLDQIYLLLSIMLANLWLIRPQPIGYLLKGYFGISRALRHIASYYTHPPHLLFKDTQMLIGHLVQMIGRTPMDLVFSLYLT